MNFTCALCSPILRNEEDTAKSETFRGAGIVLLNLIGQCGVSQLVSPMSIFAKAQKPLLGTNSFPKNQEPKYIKGMAISAAFTFFTGVLAFGLRCLLVWENQKLDKLHGSRKNRAINQPGGAGGEGQESEVGEENYGPAFRYIL